MSANAIDPALDECSVAGNNNIYGLGIRLSIYVQGFITMIAYCYKQESFKSLSTANSILRVALLLAIMYITASSPESLTSIEAVVVCGLIACLYAESANVHYTWYVPKEFTNDEIRRCWNSLGWWRTLLQYIWLFGYALWFLMKGLGGVLPPAHPNCGPEVVFVLARVRLDEKWLKIVAMILFSAVALPGLISIVLFSLPAKYRDACIEALNDPTPTKFTRSWRQIVKRTSRYGLRHSEWNIIGNGIWFVLLVLFVELPIRCVPQLYLRGGGLDV